MDGVLINIGSNSSNPNGRGMILADHGFEYLPVPEEEAVKEKAPTYEELGFDRVRFPGLLVHLDPEFETFTYGHVRRGFGDVRSLLRLNADGILFFYTNLQKENGDWAPYVIGCFKNAEVVDCRKLSKDQILELRNKGFRNNAHLKRFDPQVDLLIKGSSGSQLFEKAVRLCAKDDNLRIAKHLENSVFTAGLKKIERGKPWFRWTLVCGNVNALLKMINRSAHT
jgi:hypothetical protein